jgi:hypothetical protein
LARRRRRAEVVPIKFRRGVGEGLEEEWSASTRRSRRTFWRSWEGEGVTGGGFPTVARGGGGGALVGEEVPDEEEGEAWAQQLQEDVGKLLEQLNWAEEGRRYKLDGDRSLPAEGRTAAR